MVMQDKSLRGRKERAAMRSRALWTAVVCAVLCAAGGASAGETAVGGASVETAKPVVTSTTPAVVRTERPVRTEVWPGSDPRPGSAQMSPAPRSVDPVPGCPPGMEYDAAADKCWSLPACPDGGTFDVRTKKCAKAPVVRCAEGFRYEPSLDKCVAPPLRSGAQAAPRSASGVMAEPVGDPPAVGVGR